MRTVLFFAVCACSLLSAFNKAAAQEPAIKNVLFIISDDLKASVLGCYGDPMCKTPNLDSLASESMVFDRAYCQGTVCAPSRQSFMFSRYQGKSEVNLGQHFRENGWYSARVGKIYHMKVPGDIIAGTDGRDEPLSWTEKFNSQGQEAHSPGDYACLNLNVFTDAPENRQSTAMPHRMFVSVEIDGDGAQQPDHKSATKAIELIAEHKDAPFFLAVGLIRPHYPMVAPRSTFNQYPWQQIDLPENPANDLDDIPKLGLAGTRSGSNPIGKYPDNQRRMWAAYYASVAFMDAQVGRILRHLDELGLRESTAVVFTSDHGYHLGEHTFWQKANLHEEVVRVPLMMDVPGIKSGRSSSIVELVDIFPTLSDLAGLEIPSSVEGKSLVPVLEDPTAKVKSGAISFNKGASLRTARWHFMKYNDGSTELYDMREDPKQFTNLASDTAHSEVAKRLERQLSKRLPKGN